MKRRSRIRVTLWVFWGSQQEAGSHRVQLFVWNRRAREQSAFEPTELLLRDQCQRTKLNLTPCDWEQFLQEEQLAGDRYDRVDGTPVSSLSTALDRDCTSFLGALSEPKSRIWIRKKTSADASYAHCKGAVGKRTQKTCSKAEDDKR